MLGLFLFQTIQEEGVDITCNSLHPGVIVTNIARHQSRLTIGKPLSL